MLTSSIIPLQKKTRLWNFDENHYTQKAETISIDTTLKEDGHLLDSNQYELAAANTRTQITNAKSSKYLPTAKMIMTFKNVYNKAKKVMWH